MRDEAEKRIGHLYPPVEITPEMVRERPDLKPYHGRKLTVIAWLWARTVKSPNPAFPDVDVPLTSTFMLSTKQGKEAYVEPVIEGRSYRFSVRIGAPPDLDGAKAGTKLSRGANFRCLMSGSPISCDCVKAQGQAKRMGARLMAVVAEGNRGRIYLVPTRAHEETARIAIPDWRPDGDVPARLTGGTCVPYGLSKWGDLFTSRQLVAITTFSDLVGLRPFRNTIQQGRICTCGESPESVRTPSDPNGMGLWRRESVQRFRRRIQQHLRLD